MSQPSQVFTISQAATACAVSRKTITRRLDQLRDAGAYKDTGGQWAVPLSALLAVGLRPGRPAPPDRVSLYQDSDLGHGNTVGQVAELRLELAELRRRAEVAEALATERAERIADLRLALRQLEAPHPVAEISPRPTTETPQPGQNIGLFGSVRRILHGYLTSEAAT